MNIPGSLPVDASWLYATNMVHFIKTLFPKGPGAPDLSDEIMQSALVTHEGAHRPPRGPQGHGRGVRGDGVADLLLMLGFFAFSFGVGYLIISRIPQMLHTPLMSMTNAISAVTLLGALLLFATPTTALEKTLGAIALARRRLQHGRRLRHHRSHGAHVP